MQVSCVSPSGLAINNQLLLAAVYTRQMTPSVSCSYFLNGSMTHTPLLRSTEDDLFFKRPACGWHETPAYQSSMSSHGHITQGCQSQHVVTRPCYRGYSPSTHPHSHTAPGCQSEHASSRPHYSGMPIWACSLTTTLLWNASPST